LTMAKSLFKFIYNRQNLVVLPNIDGKMNKNEIIEILQDWNFWKKDLEAGIKRPIYLNKLKGFLKSGQIVTITGARRAGKSFLMRQLIKSLISDGVDRNNILMVNFEDPRFTELDARTLQTIYEVYLEFLNPEGEIFIFLDEVQGVSGWERWVRTIHELNKAKLVVSGSNAKLLGKELSTLLTGRHIDLVVFPLSFKEYLTFNGIDLRDRLDFISKRVEIERFFRKYVEWGGFPEVVLSSSERKQMLLHYFEDIINKDLIRRYRVRKSERLNSLAKFYLANISSSITFSSLEKFLNVSADTVEKFSRYFEDAYLLFFLKRFSFKVKEQEKSPRKVYAIDTGLASTIGFRFSQNLGRLAENIIFLELVRRRALEKNSLEIYYWKDSQHREVDFVIKEGLKVAQVMQICWEINRPETKAREIKALLKAMEKLELNEGFVITQDLEKEENIAGKKIRYVPLWKWLSPFK